MPEHLKGELELAQKSSSNTAVNIAVSILVKITHQKQSKLHLTNLDSTIQDITKQSHLVLQLIEKLEQLKLSAEKNGQFSGALKSTSNAQQRNVFDANKFTILIFKLPNGLVAYRGLDLIEFT